MTRLIIFTDLDGTLLDHKTYSFHPALPVLERLKAARIPVILASSKTAAEIGPLQRELGLEAWPAIVENGAGILCPQASAGEFSGSYEQIRQTIKDVDPDGCFQGFGDWNVDEVVRRTGLDPAAAEQAKQRQYSEPGRFSGSEAQRAVFIEALRDVGLDARMGGRFLTIAAPGTKAARMSEITARLFEGEAVRSVALGDAPNDVEMLEAADQGFIVANPAHTPLPELDGERKGRIVRTTLAGPAGWAQAIGALLDRMNKPD